MNIESDPATERLLITGATGFLGKAVAEQAIERGLVVRATGRLANPAGLECEYVQADLLSADLDALLEGVSTVVHIAGLAHVFDKSKGEEQFFDVNANASERLAAAARRLGVRNMVLASSVAVYGGNVHGPCDENARCAPVSAYARSKLEGERLATSSVGDHMSLTILRLATLYGPGDPGNVARLMSSIDRGKFIWIGEGSNRKSLVYRDDAARACLDAALAPHDSLRVYNVSAAPETMATIVGTLARCLGKPASRIQIPAWLASGGSTLASALCLNRGPAASIKRMIQTWLADDVYTAELIERDLGWQADTPLEAGLAKEVEWYQNNKSVVQ